MGSYLPGTSEDGLSAEDQPPWSRGLLQEQAGYQPAPSPDAFGHRPDPKSHRLKQLPLTPSSCGYRFQEEFIIPRKMSVSVSSGHQINLSPWLSGSLEHLCWASTKHVSMPSLKTNELLKTFPTPARGGSGSEKKNSFAGSGREERSNWSNDC